MTTAEWEKRQITVPEHFLTALAKGLGAYLKAGEIKEEDLPASKEHLQRLVNLAERISDTRVQAAKAARSAGLTTEELLRGMADLPTSY
jgi:hypothetical protein